jgi:hypothetical protein
VNNDNIHSRENRHKNRKPLSQSEKTKMQARGRLKDARHWFLQRYGSALPRISRGRRILSWVADHARLGYPANPEGAVRRCCGELAPWLKVTELDELVAESEESNKCWTNDQSAMVLEIGVRVWMKYRYRFLGACDDPDHEVRSEDERARNAAYSRKYRAGKGASTKRGRPRLNLSEADRAARRRRQAAERKRAERCRKKAAMSGEGDVTPKSSGHNIVMITSDEFSVTSLLVRRTPQASRRQPRTIDVDSSHSVSP